MPNVKVIYLGMPPKFDDLGYNQALSDVKKLNPNLKFEE